MASEYNKSINPFQDYLIHNLVNGVDFKDKENIDELISTMLEILEYILETDEYSHLFMVDIVDDGDNCLVYGKNLITSLWLIGIFPNNIEKVILNNSLLYDGKQYTYNYDSDEFIINKLIN